MSNNLHKNYEEEKRKNTFEKCLKLGHVNKQNISLYEATKRNSLKRRRQKNGKGSPRN